MVRGQAVDVFAIVGGLMGSNYTSSCSGWVERLSIVVFVSRKDKGASNIRVLRLVGGRAVLIHVREQVG